MAVDSGLAAVTAALGLAAERRGITETPGWIAVLPMLLSATGHDPHIDSGARIDEALGAITSVFALDQQCADLLLIVAAADLDPNVALAYGLLLGADGPRPANQALALELAGIPLLSPTGRAALGPVGPLRRWGLVRLGDGAWELGRSLTADAAVVGALLGEPLDDPVSLAMALPAQAPDGDLTSAGVPELTAALAAGHPLCWVENPTGGAGAAVAGAAFAHADIRCVSVDLALRPTDTSWVDAMGAAVRYAGLRRAGLIVESAELVAKDVSGATAIGLLTDAPVPVVMVGGCRWNASWRRTLPVTVRAAPLSTAERLAVWRHHLSTAQVSDAALMAYRLAPNQIHVVARHAVEQATLTGREVSAAVVSESMGLLGGSSAVRAGHGRVRTTFADLQVPEETRGELERLASWVRLRDSVIAGGEVHGLGGKGTGIAALFTGNPGTGKTLAAHVIADTAGLDLMQVDLSGVVDKYIGETEKNLERVFREAESLNVVLFFDEADALFGKRSEVRDAHDRFANQEVSYLLQRIEQFDGVTVLATNLKGNLDVAFSRRLHFIVHFPDPDESTRIRLWQQLLARAGDIDPDDPIDVPTLAGALEVAGGDLRNIVLAAAYDAASMGSALGMRHVLAAARREYAKLGRRTPARLGFTGTNTE